MGVMVGSLGVPVVGSSVSIVPQVGLQVTEPWFETCAVVLLGQGLLTVTRNLMMMLLPAGSVPTATETGALSGAAAPCGSGLGCASLATTYALCLNRFARSIGT